MSEIKFISTDLLHEARWDGFGWYGEVLMAKKTDMENQIVVLASGTGCVINGKKSLNMQLEENSFPNGFDQNEYVMIGFYTWNKKI